MEKVNAERDRLLVCRACGMLRDPPDVFAGLRQRCGCEGAPGHRGRWSIDDDFNLRHELCRLCGATALRSGHRFCIWFCPPCRAEVVAANARLGGYVIPIGRHSLHAGRWVAPGAPRPGRDTQIDGMVLFIRGLPQRMSALGEWRADQVRRLWAEAGLRGDDIVLPQFEAEVGIVVGPPEDLVPGLLEHLSCPL